DMVFYLTARSMCGSGSIPVAIVLVGLLTAGGNGALSLSFDQNCGGATTSVTALLGTYIVASNGRSTVVIGRYHTVAYLVGGNHDDHFWAWRERRRVRGVPIEVCSSPVERSESRSLDLRGVFTSFNPLFADAKPDECCWRRTIFHGHGDPERAGSRRGCTSSA